VEFIPQTGPSKGTYVNGGAKWKPALETWYHAVGTFGGSGSRIMLYINGNLVSQSDVINVDPWIKNEILGIGDWGDGTNNRDFKGVSDDIRIYNRALSAAEVLSLYDTEKP
jgi:hypothetical protein